MSEFFIARRVIHGHSLLLEHFPMAGAFLSETVAFSVEFSKLNIAIPQVRLTRYRRILFCAQYPKA